MHFEWDISKEAENLAKHGVDFSTVGIAWSDPCRIIFRYLGWAATNCVGNLLGMMVGAY